MVVTLRNFEMRAGDSLPLSGLTVTLYEASLTHPNTGSPLDTTTTNISGMWEFVDISDGVYDVQVEIPAESKDKWYKGNCAFSFIADIPFRNKIDNPFINGDHRIWSREFTSGSQYTAVADGQYLSDRFQYTKAGTMVHDAIRSSDVPPVSFNVPYATYSLMLDCTTADGTIAAGDICTLGQKIVGYNWEPFAQAEFTVGFWLKVFRAGTYCVSFRNKTTADRYYIQEITCAAGVWEYHTITVPASPSAGNWDYTSGTGLDFRIVLACGSTLGGGLANGAWNTGAHVATANQINACADSTGSSGVDRDYVKLWGLTMDPGDQVLPFWPRHRGLEEFLCAQYFQYWYLTEITYALTNGVGSAYWYARLPLVPFMRGTPVLSALTSSNFSIYLTVGGANDFNNWTQNSYVAAKNYVSIMYYKGIASQGVYLVGSGTATAEL